MLSFADYRKHDALALAELVKTKKVTPQDLLDAALSRMREVNPKINAVVLEHEDVARKAIKDGLPQGPLHGVPYLLKDLGALLKGTVTTGSLKLTREAVEQLWGMLDTWMAGWTCDCIDCTAERMAEEAQAAAARERMH